MALRLTHNNKFEANKWLIIARWFYIPAVFLIGFFLHFYHLGNNAFPFPIMLGLFFVFVLVNLWFWVRAKRIELDNNFHSIDHLAIVQILAELLFFLAVFHFLGGDQSIAMIFFFIPIVSSLVLFDVMGSLFVSLLVCVCVGASLFLDYFGYLKHVWGYAGAGFDSFEDFVARFMVVTTYGATYFIVGTFAGYFSSFIRRREALAIEHKHRAQLQTERLRLLNNEYDEYIRTIARHDMEIHGGHGITTDLARQKSEFISAVAHQLRTPLSATKWALDLILKEEGSTLTSDQKALLMKAYESNERIINLIRDMLGVDRLESGSADFSFLDVNLARLVDNLVLEFESEIERKGIDVKVTVEPDMPVVSVDPQKIRAVFQNLMENALKYTHRSISIDIRKEGNKARVVFGDDGIGIPKDQYVNIFKRFFRAENAMKRDPEGTGLGLFIVRTIVERHGGSIAFESIEGKGATFILTLPLRH